MNSRQRTILNHLSKTGKVSVNELIDMLEVSGVTIRQDLDSLQKQGFVQRVHGGAVLQSEDEISHRLGINYDAKMAIAEKAAEYIIPGETVFIEAGSANALLARQMADESGLTVVTNNVFITRTLKDSEVNVILLGGLFQHQSECVVGTLARAGLDAINFSKCFLGVDGIAPRTGVTGTDMLRAEVSTRAAMQSREVFILTDSRKIGRTAMTRICGLEDIDYLITDDGIPSDIRVEFENVGINVMIAGPSEDETTSSS